MFTEISVIQDLFTDFSIKRKYRLWTVNTEATVNRHAIISTTKFAYNW